jgi:hypothetical protein
MINQDIRDKAKKSKVKLWEIAEVLDMADSNFSKKLRKELPSTEKQKIFSIIEDLAKRR